MVICDNNFGSHIKISLRRYQSKSSLNWCINLKPSIQVPLMAIFEMDYFKRFETKVFYTKISLALTISQELELN